MHKKLLKGIAAVMSAALVLGSVVTGVVPANAAEASVLDESSGWYKTTYNMSDLKIEPNNSWGRPSNTETQGTSVSLTFSGQWSGEYFTIPTEVKDAGFKGAEIKFTEPNAIIGLKCGGDHEYGWDILKAFGQTEIWADSDIITEGKRGTAWEDYYENANNTPRSEKHLPLITAVGIFQVESGSCTVVAETITFYTEKAAVEGADPGTEEPTTPNPGTTHTSTQTENGYETAYALADVELIYKADTATIDGNKIEWTNHWGNIFYKIPQEIMDAGLIGFYCKGTTEGAKVDLKIANKDDIWGTALVDKYTDTFDGAIAEITADQRATATAFCIMSNCEENESMSATIDNVVFITENAIAGGTTDPGTDPDPGNDPTPATPGKAKITSITSTNNSVTLKWKKVKNSTAYEVYRATSKNGEYKLIKTVKKATFTNKKLKANKKYFYKVKAINTETGAEGALSAAKNIKTKK